MKVMVRMNYKNLTDLERRRFNKACSCQKCKQPIKPNENFYLVKKRNKRCKEYFFYHIKCENVGDDFNEF